MALSLTVFIPLLSLFVGAPIAWFTLWSAKISEKFKDLQAGEPARNKYLADKLSSLMDSVSSSVRVIEQMTSNPDIELTSKLREQVDTLGDSIEDLSTVQDAMQGIVGNLRRTRDKGLLFIILTGFIMILGLAGIYSGNEYGLAIGLVLIVFYLYSSVFVVNILIWRPIRQFRQVQKLLIVEKLYRVGG